jgi:hypothetical protein
LTFGLPEAAAESGTVGFALAVDVSVLGSEMEFRLEISRPSRLAIHTIPAVAAAARGQTIKPIFQRECVAWAAFAFWRMDDLWDLALGGNR